MKGCGSDSAWIFWNNYHHLHCCSTAALNLVTPINSLFEHRAVIVLCSGLKQDILPAVCVYVCVGEGEQAGRRAMRNINNMLSPLWLQGCYHDMSHHECVTTFERQTAYWNELGWGGGWGSDVGLIGAFQTWCKHASWVIWSQADSTDYRCECTENGLKMHSELMTQATFHRLSRTEPCAGQFS